MKTVGGSKGVRRAAERELCDILSTRLFQPVSGSLLREVKRTCVRYLETLGCKMVIRGVNREESGEILLSQFTPRQIDRLDGCLVEVEMGKDDTMESIRLMYRLKKRKGETPIVELVGCRS